MSFCPFARNNSAPIRWNFVKFGARGFFGNLLRKWKFHYNPMIIIGSVLKTTTYIYDNLSQISDLNEKFLRKNCRANQDTHFMFSNFFKENLAVY
jgi:hypothetical protein